jgi:hypothetical protein
VIPKKEFLPEPRHLQARSFPNTAFETNKNKQPTWSGFANPCTALHSPERQTLHRWEECESNYLPIHTAAERWAEFDTPTLRASHKTKSQTALLGKHTTVKKKKMKQTKES